MYSLFNCDFLDDNYQISKHGYDDIVLIFNKENEMDMMDLNIKTLTGKTITFKVKPFYTIKQIKVLIQNKEGISANDSRLIFSGKQLESNRFLFDYNVKNESTFHLTL